jgi:hypothetical protein
MNIRYLVFIDLVELCYEFEYRVGSRLVFPDDLATELLEWCRSQGQSGHLMARIEEYLGN